MLSLANTCPIIMIPLSSASSFVWGVIHFLWSWYGFWILIGLIVWSIIEIFTRNGKLHYNSANGFSPAFNIFIGSGTYWGIQSLLLIILKKVFGEAVYCFIWPYPVHIIIFLLTGLFLHFIGFWPYLKEPGTKRPHKNFRRKKYR